MNTSMLIKGGTVLDPGSATEALLDLRITDGVLAEFKAGIEPIAGESVLNAQGMWVTPGFIDLHVHLRDFAQCEREDIDSGTKAAAAGGFVTVVAMANTDPPMDNPLLLSQLLKKIEEKAHIEVLPVACVTRGMKGEQLTDMVELAELGAVAFSDDGMTVGNLGVLRRAMEYARLADRLIISHAEDHDLKGGGLIQEGATAVRLGLPGAPCESESAAVAREIEVVHLTGGRVHFTHITCERSVNLIRKAKAEGLAVTADVTPHHLTLSVDDIKGYDTSFKMNPPLRHASDQRALIEGLRDGTIDAIATDHAPHARSEKARPFAEAPVGLIGLETAFPLALERLVAGHHLTKMQLVSLFTTGPARVLNLPQPSLSCGTRASLALLDPHQSWRYDATKGFSKSSNSPYHGRPLVGKPLMTICNGKTVYIADSLASRMSINAQVREG